VLLVQGAHSPAWRDDLPAALDAMLALIAAYECPPKVRQSRNEWQDAICYAPWCGVNHKR
jgi:hypothetical protein